MSLRRSGLLMSPTISAIADTSSIPEGSHDTRYAALLQGGMVDESWRVRLDAAIEASEGSLRTVSLKAGLSPGYVHGILRDNKEPTLDRFIRICQAAGVSATYVLLGADVSPETEEIIRALEDHPERRGAILSLLKG